MGTWLPETCREQKSTYEKNFASSWFIYKDLNVIFIQQLHYCPTNALNYINCRIIENTLKNVKAAPTCFGSRRNHHQGDKVSAQLKLQVWFHCACGYERCQCYGGIFRPVVRVCGSACMEVLIQQFKSEQNSLVLRLGVIVIKRWYVV